MLKPHKLLFSLFRLVKVGSRSLRHTEAARTDVEVWIPSTGQFTTVSVCVERCDFVPVASTATLHSCVLPLQLCGVAMWGDYMSRRLMIKHSKSFTNTTDAKYVHTVSPLR